MRLAAPQLVMRSLKSFVFSAAGVAYLLTVWIKHDI
jgi:hypothetical protein